MALGLTARLFFFRKAALVAEVAPAALAERNREEMVRAVMAVTAVMGSPGQEDLEGTVQPEEPVTILAETVVTALMGRPSVTAAPAVAVVGAATVVAVVQPPSLMVLAEVRVDPVNKEQQKSTTTVQEMAELALPEVMGQ